MNVLHCAAQNNRHEVIQFIFDSFDGLDVNISEKVSQNFAVPLLIIEIHVLGNYFKYDDLTVVSYDY